MSSSIRGNSRGENSRKQVSQVDHHPGRANVSSNIPVRQEFAPGRTSSLPFKQDTSQVTHGHGPSEVKTNAYLNGHGSPSNLNSQSMTFQKAHAGAQMHVSPQSGLAEQTYLYHTPQKAKHLQKEHEDVYMLSSMDKRVNATETRVSTTSGVRPARVNRTVVHHTSKMQHHSA